MTIYVDQLREYDPAYEYSEWCHMLTDGSIGELHAFAREIGVHSIWFRERPHRLYVLNYRTLRRAVEHSAQEIPQLPVALIEHCDDIFQRRIELKQASV